MTATILAALLSLSGVLAVGLVTYLAARRRTSGNVATSSDAASLWTESKSMREELRNQVVELRLELKDTGSRLSDAVVRITDLLHQIEVSNAATVAARRETELSRAETVQLKRAIEAVHSEVKTGNALTLGALADNEESRRIKLIPDEDRTAAEHEHIDTVGIQTHSPGGNNE